MSGLVRDAHDAPERRVGNDATSVREVIDAASGCGPFSLRVLRSVTGRSAERATGAAEELLFVVAGNGLLMIGAEHLVLEPEMGVLLRPGERYELHNDRADDLVVVSVSLHEPIGGSGRVVSRLADAVAQSATAAREFRIVFDGDCGCPTATQFVGYIPVGAAPLHYHLYEEVIYVLDGNGVMHMNDTEAALRSGSCIHLPPRKLHILENSGPGVMRVLGVFRPAGSPAAAFYPDGTPAYTAGESQTVSTTN